MKMEEFEKLLNENQELAQKFEKLKEEKCKEVNSDSELCNTLSDIAKELGASVDPSEFELDKLMKKEMNDEELQAVSGGYIDEYTGACILDYRCYGTLWHPDSVDKYRGCFSDYLCITIYHHSSN